MDSKIKVIEFDFNTGKNKMNKKERKPSASPSISPPSIKTWSSDPEWFGDGYVQPKDSSFKSPLNFTHPHTENIMEIQERNVAEAYMTLMKAKRDFLQEKKKLNKLYEEFDIKDLKI